MKRWSCSDVVKDEARYELESAPLLKLKHPLVPQILDHFVEEKNYYHVQTYMDGESLEDRLQKLLQPLEEQDVVHFMSIVLNILIALEQLLPPNSYHYCSITPQNIIFDNKRDRVFLTGFQLSHRSTRKLSSAMALSPFMPIEGGAYDSRKLMYGLAACAYYALANSEPSIGAPLPSIRSLNAKVSLSLGTILERALHENSEMRYQDYSEMQYDIKQLVATMSRSFKKV